MRELRAAIVLVLFIGQATSCTSQRLAPPSGAGGDLRDIAIAEDVNPAPGIVEINLTAAPMQYEFVKGQPTTVLAYNGSIPGPLIECKQGDELIVHFTNQLAHETTIHWHGIRLPANMDGSHLSQAPVPPGGSFTYHFTMPDAALFWYHPHHMGQDQIYRGLYGPLRVRGAVEPAMTRERVIVLSDIGLDASGQVIPPMDLVMSQADRAMGVMGNTILVNGQTMPTIAMQPGGRERWRIVNGAGARGFDLTLPGHTFTMVGTDGGLLNAPVSLDHVLLTPGERIDVIVDAPAAGTPPLKLLAAEHTHVLGLPPMMEEQLATVSAAGEPATAPAIPATLGAVPALDPGSPLREFILNSKMVPTPESPAGQQPGGGQFDFLINGKKFPDVTPFTVNKGTVELWDIENHSQMEHPFHVHGMRFQVVGTDGVPPVFGGWKDTVNLPNGNAAPSHTRLLVSFDGEPGGWLYHCHNLFHQENGMMAEFTVTP